VTQREERGRSTEKNLDELEAGIAETRAAITRGIEVLSEKLSPEHIKEEAKERLSEAKDAGMEKVREVKEQATEAATRTARTGMDFVRDNSIPLAFIGVGLGLLARRSRQTEKEQWPAISPTEEWAEESGAGESRAAERVRELGEEGKEKARDVAERARERASELGEQGREMAERARKKASELGERAERRIGTMRDRTRHGLQTAQTRARDVSNENPVAVGAAALIAGLGLGLLLPATRRENELMGSLRDRLAREGQRTLGEVRRAVGETAREVRSTVSETAHH